MWPNLEVTPKPRELTEEEYKVFFGENCWYPNKKFEPTFEMTSNVWAMASRKDLPVYRIYYCGTNCFKVLKYTWYDDKWECIKLEEIEDLYGYFWKIILHISSLGWKYSEWDKSSWSSIT